MPDQVGRHAVATKSCRLQQQETAASYLADGICPCEGCLYRLDQLPQEVFAAQIALLALLISAETQHSADNVLVQVQVGNVWRGAMFS